MALKKSNAYSYGTRASISFGRIQYKRQLSHMTDTWILHACNHVAHNSCRYDQRMNASDTLTHLMPCMWSKAIHQSNQRDGLMGKTLGLGTGRSGVHQRGGLMDKNLGLSAGRSGVHQRGGRMDKTLGDQGFESRVEVNVR